MKWMILVGAHLQEQNKDLDIPAGTGYRPQFLQLFVKETLLYVDTELSARTAWYR